jgi:hypothetical protein
MTADSVWKSIEVPKVLAVMPKVEIRKLRVAHGHKFRQSGTRPSGTSTRGISLCFSPLVLERRLIAAISLST